MRRAFTLRKVYEMAPPDIAGTLGLTEAEVERHLITAALACGRHFADPANARAPLIRSQEEFSTRS
jgi:DNA-directed RNA polymerase specialized sigma24 family protein